MNGKRTEAPATVAQQYLTLPVPQFFLHKDTPQTHPHKQTQNVSCFLFFFTKFSDAILASAVTDMVAQKVMIKLTTVSRS